MIQLIVCVTIGIAIASFVHLISQNETSHKHNTDEKRLEYKRKGLVLHIPSYYNGTEVYCLPRFQYDKKANPWNLERV